MMNLTKSLLDAISIIATKTAEEVSSDKTIKGIVKKIVSISEGKYLITYNDGSFYAYTESDSKKTFSVGEEVYILVPEGDMSQKKFILGKVENEEIKTSLKTSKNSLLNNYVVVGNNSVIDEGYGWPVKRRMQPLQLNPYKINDFYYCYLRNKNEVKELNSDFDSEIYPVIKIDEESFSNSAKTAEALLVRAKFKTSIDTKNIGNYGIIINIAFADKTNPETDEHGNITYSPKLIAYILDTSKMTGNPMKFYDYSSQYMIAEFNGEDYLYIDSIVAFSEGFVNSNDEIINYDNDNNIFIKDLEVIGLNEVSATSGDYKLRLSTPRGNTVRIGEKNSLKITATMSYLDQDISKDSVYYWGIKDPLITSTSDNYNAKLGSGYRYIDTTNIENKNELTLVPAELTAVENSIICVGVYKSDIILKAPVLIYNNNNKLDITIESDQGTNFQFNEGNPVLTCLINGKSSNYQEAYQDSAFSFVWSREDAELGTILLNETEAKLEADRDRELQECRINGGLSNEGRTNIQILSYYSTRISQVKDILYFDGVHGSKIQCRMKNTNNYVIYSCSVYRAGVYVGYASITLHNSKDVINNNYYITITNGTQVFQYDERGISPSSEKQKNPIEIFDLIAIFHSPQGMEVTPKKVRWIVPENNTLIDIPYLGLETDAETGEKYFLGNIYPLRIKSTYENNCNNNQIIAVVTHADGTEYRQSTNLLFTKIGDLGTNGTDTVVKINELVNIPIDECLTMIKEKNIKAFYNGGYSEDIPVLETSLYTNNTQVLGHTTKWTIAGTSNTQSRCYQIKNDRDACIINYNEDNEKLDTRIVKAETSLNGKSLFSFYGIPTIEYSSENYNYDNYKIKVLKDKTLRNILYNSNGANPSYNTNQGVHVKLEDWDETGYLEWSVESGVKKDGVYENPNFLLSRSPKSKTGSRVLKVNYDIENIQSLVFQVRDTGKFCANMASTDIKKYINEFLSDVEKFCIDEISSVQDKLNNLKNRLERFKDKTPDKKNVYINTVYEEYNSLFNKMTEEYLVKQDVNKKSTEIYDKVQSIWKGEWPGIITEDKLCLSSRSKIKTIQQLIEIYQRAYDNRSNNDRIIKVAIEEIIDASKKEYYASNDNNQRFYIYDKEESSDLFEIGEYVYILIPENDIDDEEQKRLILGSADFEKGFSSKAWEKFLINNYINTGDFREEFIINAEDGPQLLTILNKLDTYYDTYITTLGAEAVWVNPILIEYSKILNAYLNILINETQDCFNGEYLYNDEEENSKNLYEEISQRYNLAYYDWSGTNNSQNYSIIGQNIYESVVSSKEIIANVYNNIRELYKYYQTLYLNVKKYLVAEDSITLTTWNYILNGQEPDLLEQIYVVPNDTFNGLYMNNNVVGRAFIRKNNQEVEIAKIYIPIIMTLNTYELAALNGWDGTSIEIGDEHIMTPQIGAGVKNNTTNTFTGIVMGVIGNPTIDKKSSSKFDNVNKVGLLGYSNGQQSVFIDSETGKACFGLPDKDIDNENGTNEGRIELIPGGVSKIGNWKIGNRFLYNIIDGNYERRSDKDARNNSSQYKLMVPHDKHGIILSSDQPYIHIKGEVYEDKNLSGINYNDEYNDINPGDSLELRLDPGDKSLFSIVQHTAGFGDLEDDSLLFGYCISNPEASIKVVKNYISNKNTGMDVEDNDGAEYYIYSLVTNNLTGDYVPYYRQQRGSESDPGLEKIDGYWENSADSEDYSWSTAPFNGHNQQLFLKDFLTQENFSKSVGDSPVFTIDKDTGIITYNPENLVWVNGEKGFSNNDGWQSVTGRISSENNFIIDLEYNKNITVPINKPNLKIGKIKNNTEYSIYKILFNYTIHRELIKMNFNNFTEAYIQFYIVENENDTIDDNVLLKSDKISIYNNNDNIDIELFSYNNNKLLSNNTYVLKMDLYVNNYTVNSNYRYLIKKSSENYKMPSFDPDYGLLELTNQDLGERSFTTFDGSLDTISGTYEIYKENNERKIRFKVNSPQVYDFIFWNKKGESSNIICGGQTVLDDYAKFFTNQEKTLDELNNYQILTEDLSQNNSWYIGFYPKEYYTTEIISYIDNSSSDSNDDNTEQIEKQDIDTIKKYKIENVQLTDKKLYSLNWEGNNYNTASIFWSLDLINLNFGDVLGFVPNDLTTLCIEGDITTRSESLQGIPYSKTFWENGVQKVTFYRDYYDWVNINQNKINQYGYINVSKDKNNSSPTYYKYIKTLAKQDVNSWFTDTNLPSASFTSGNKVYGVRDWITAPVSADAFKKAVYWKEFIRVGLDENGRLFSAGVHDKRTYSRTGRIYAFGKVPKLYGQEIRTQTGLNSYTPIIKIFTQIEKSNESDVTYTPNTTYITQGQNDTGNISIRTTGENNYVELAASASSENGTNTVPEKTSWIKVSHNAGVQLQSQYTDITDIESTTHTNSLTLLGEKGLILNANIMSLSAGGTPENPNVTYQISDTYNWIKTQNYILSSVSSSTPVGASKASLKNQYRVQAFVENNSPQIQLEVGSNKAGLNIKDNQVELRLNSSQYIFMEKSDKFDQYTTYLKNDNMEISLGNDIIRLRDNSNKSYIEIGPISDKNYANISLYSNGGGAISIDNTVRVQGKKGLIVTDGPGVFNQKLYTKDNLYSNNNIYVGYNVENNTSQIGGIYLYKNNSRQYVRLLAEPLEQLFKWYNEKRWMIGWNGTTVWFKNVGRSSNPEGSFNSDDNKYHWEWMLFEKYTGTGI